MTDEPRLGLALEAVLTRFRALFVQIARARGVRSDELDEIVQDIRLRLWKAQGTAEKIEGLSTSYLMRVATSAVIDRLRARPTRHVPLPDGEGMLPSALQVAPDDGADRSALAQQLAQALDRLARNRRILVQLHLEGYDRREMAEMTGWSEAKVRNLLYRGLDDLRAAMDTARRTTPAAPTEVRQDGVHDGRPESEGTDDGG